MVATEPFSHAERLEILIHAIETAIITRAKLEKEVLSSSSDFDRIEFLPDDEEANTSVDDILSHRLDRGRLDAAERIRSDLTNALRKLRRAVDAGT